MQLFYNCIEEETFKREIAVIGGSMERSKTPLLYSPFQNSKQKSCDISNGLSVSRTEISDTKSVEQSTTTGSIENQNIQSLGNLMCENGSNNLEALFKGKDESKKDKKRKRKEKAIEKEKNRRGKKRSRKKHKERSQCGETLEWSLSNEKTSLKLSAKSVSPYTPPSLDLNDNIGDAIFANDGFTSQPRDIHRKSSNNISRPDDLLANDHMNLNGSPKAQKDNDDNSHDDMFSALRQDYQKDEPNVENQDDIHKELLQQTQNIVDRNSIGFEFPPPLLCSERFIENYSQTATELTSGSWSNLKTDESLKTRMRFLVCDCPLVDEIHVDIELPCQSAIAVTTVSSWYSRGDCLVRDASKRLLEVAATGRYQMLMVVLSIDIPLSPTVANDIATLQNSIVVQSGNPCFNVNIQYATPSSLGNVIGSRVMDVLKSYLVNLTFNEFSWIENCSTDVGIQERSRFLLQIAPSMTAFSALQCIRCYSNIALTTFDDDTEFEFEAGSSLSCFLQHISRTNKFNVEEVVRRQGVTCANSQSLIHLILAITVALSN